MLALQHTILALFALLQLASARSIVLARSTAFLTSSATGQANVSAIASSLRGSRYKFAVNNVHIENNLPASSKVKRQATSGTKLVDQASGTMWTGSITVGSPAKTFQLDFDTGSTDTILCGSAACSLGNARAMYTTAKSSTSKVTVSRFSSVYGDGSSTVGTVVKDIIRFGTVHTTMGINIASAIGGALGTFPTDGIMGFAYPFLSATGMPSFTTNLLKGGAIRVNQFAFRLSTTPGVSELFVGGYNPKKMKGSIAWYPVILDPTYGVYTYFQLGNAHANINGVKVANTAPAFLIDTGSTLIIAPLNDATSFWNSVPGSIQLSGAWQGYWSFPCATAPVVSFSFSGNSIQHTVNPADFNLGTYPGTPSQCVGALVSGNPVGTSWVLGDVFLLGQYSIFNVGTNQIGFATPV